MTVKSSGEIFLSDLQDEFGGPTPVVLSNYYRGGSYVPDTAANAGIPTSGQLFLSDFYGSSADVGGSPPPPPPPADLTPNAVNWTFAGGGNAGSTNIQTISGISQPIQLQAQFSGAMAPGNKITVNDLTTNALNPFSVSNNGDVRFFAYCADNQIMNGTVTIINVSTGTTLDTFNINIVGNIGDDGLGDNP